MKTQSKEESRALLRKIFGPQRIEIKDELERDKLWVLFNLVGITSESNNQHISSEVYHVGGKEYHVHYGIHKYPMIEEILVDKDEA